MTDLLTRAAGYLSGFTFKFWLAVCAALLACLPVAYCKGHGDGENAASAEYEAAARKAVERAREADTAAGETVTETRNEVENGNERARNAANGSDDPLRDGLGSLR